LSTQSTLATAVQSLQYERKRGLDMLGGRRTNA
jgi:hypothetical protein